MISLRSYPWLVDHRDERNAKMGTRDLSSSSSENVTKRLWFSIKCILFSRKFYEKIVRRLFFLVLWSTIFVYRVSDLFKSNSMQISTEVRQGSKNKNRSSFAY